MATMYLAQDLKHDRRVVVNVLPAARGPWEDPPALPFPEDEDTA